MKFVLSVILVALLSAVAEHFFPWWSVAVVCFIVSLLMKQGGGRAFLMGFCGVGIFWLIATLLHDVANDHILSGRMASLFHLPGYVLFIVVTVLIGALVGGLSSWTGALIRPEKVLP